MASSNATPLAAQWARRSISNQRLTEPRNRNERALAETKLPERPDYEWVNKFLIKARRETVD